MFQVKEIMTVMVQVYQLEVKMVTCVPGERDNDCDGAGVSARSENDDLHSRRKR